jgi:hypothetical protein
MKKKEKKRKVIGVSMEERNTKVVTAMIETSTYERYKATGCSIRELIIKGIRTHEGFEQELRELRQEVRDLRGSHKILYGKVMTLLNERNSTVT